MALGEAWWFFEDSSPPDAEAIFGLLERHGIRLRHPSEDSIFVLLDDGSRREVRFDDVVREWTTSTVLTFQAWLGSDTDVLVTVERLGRLVTFDLDGLSLQEATAVVSSLIACARLALGSQMLVVDKRLPDYGVAWIRSSSEIPFLPPENADVLVSIGPDGDYRVDVGPSSWFRA